MFTKKTIFFLTGKIKYFNNRKGPFKNEKSVVLHIFFSTHPWPLGDLQNSIVLKENCSRVWCGVWGWLVWLIKALCLEQMEKGKLPCYTGSVFKKEASVGQMGASVFGFAESGVSMRWKVEREKGDAMGWMFVPPSSCVEALTHTHTHPTVWWALEVGPLGVIRVRWGHKGWAPMMGLMPLKKKKPESSPSLHQIQQGERYAQTKKSVLTRHGIC